LLKSRPDFSRWSLRHHIYKEDKTLAAIINLDAAWMDITKRKLTVPDPFIQKVFANFPKSEGFEWVDPLKK